MCVTQTVFIDPNLSPTSLLSRDRAVGCIECSVSFATCGFTLARDSHDLLLNAHDNGRSFMNAFSTYTRRRLLLQDR
jgi:hypothetical protein